MFKNDVYAQKYNNIRESGYINHIYCSLDIESKFNMGRKLDKVLFWRTYV